MTVQAQYLAYILEQLAGLPALRSNRMFGGIGLYSDGLFFGLIDDDTLYFKTDDSNIAPYRERQMARFMPFPDRPEAVLGYHQVPADVIEDAETLVDWARKSVAVALSAQAAKAVRKSGRAARKTAKRAQPVARRRKSRGNKPRARKPARSAARKPARKPVRKPGRKPVRKAARKK
jgi:DNA transformation protein